MTSGILWLLLGTLFAVGEFAIGFFMFSKADDIAAKNNKPAAPLRLLGRGQMIGSVVILIAVIGIAFGLVHPFPNIQSIQF